MLVIPLKQKNLKQKVLPLVLAAGLAFGTTGCQTVMDASLPLAPSIMMAIDTIETKEVFKQLPPPVLLASADFLLLTAGQRYFAATGNKEQAEFYGDLAKDIKNAKVLDEGLKQKRQAKFKQLGDAWKQEAAFKDLSNQQTLELLAVLTPLYFAEQEVINRAQLIKDVSFTGLSNAASSQAMLNIKFLPQYISHVRQVSQIIQPALTFAKDATLRKLQLKQSAIDEVLDEIEQE